MNPTARLPLPISTAWFQAAIVTYVFGFTGLGICAYLVYSQGPPVPTSVVTTAGQTVFTGEDVMRGMNVFQRNGVMQYGTVYGHGAYLGPDFTADYLHRAAEYMGGNYDRPLSPGTSVEEAVVAELRQNTYNAADGVLTWSPLRAAAHRKLVDHYVTVFQSEVLEGGRQTHWIPDPEEVRQLTAFFAWTAWTAAAQRPGLEISYSNNWPPEPLAGNRVTPDALIWSVISIAGLLGGAGVVFYLFGRYDWLGWGEGERRIRLRSIEGLGLTPAQRAVLWFLVVSSVLFVMQTLLGGLAAHYRAEPEGFFGFDFSQWLPYNIVRTWHVQLAIFWVSASFIATGIFILPLIARREPGGQGTLTIVLLAAVTLVVFGSLAGEYAGVKGWLGAAWFWLGHQGWEYIDLGRIWQALLVIGLLFWVFIIYRGLRGTMRQEHPGRMPWLLFYAALAIPAFYAVGMLAGRRDPFVVTDFWRFWVVHLWVEDFLELFTTVIVAYMFVLLGMVRISTATRVIYLDIILYSLGGVIGTMHHLYFSGSPAAVMALGATFSALEVVPLLLLTLEAWGFIRSGARSVTAGLHPHKWAVWFLVAVGIWNFFGAGVFGFLINLPIVSYYEIGTALTANHGHTSMMGVYGMLAAGLLLFCLRYMVDPAHWSDRLAKLSFWSLNIGLAWMAFANLFPLGIVQLYTAVAQGYWYARSLEFVRQPWVNALEWARLPGDLLFIVGGAVPLLILCLRAIRYPNRALVAPETAIAEPLYTEETAS